jgi:hypothetical protein
MTVKQEIKELGFFRAQIDKPKSIEKRLMLFVIGLGFGRMIHGGT